MTTAASPAPLAPIHRGMSFGFWARAGYFASPAAAEAVDRMADTGIDHVCLIVMVNAESAFSTRQYRDFVNTPSDLEVARICDRIHAKGMKVQLRPMLDSHDGLQRLHINFPNDGLIIPGHPHTYWQQWFASFEARCLYYARLARETGCEVYGLDSELDQTARHDAPWRRIVQAVRSEFSGHVTSSFTEGCPISKHLEKPDCWFRELDSLGLSMYNGLGRHDEDLMALDTPALVARVADLVARDQRRAESLGKPIYFGEIGSLALAGALARPSDRSFCGSHGYDGEAQARYLDVLLSAYWEQPWFGGAYWWKWEEQNDRPEFRDDPRGDKGFTIDGKPAQALMRRWYSRPERRA
jgi:hypothetical protein